MLLPRAHFLCAWVLYLPVLVHHMCLGLEETKKDTRVSKSGCTGVWVHVQLTYAHTLHTQYNSNLKVSLNED